MQKERDATRQSTAEQTALFKELYEDNLPGRVTNKQLRIPSGGYSAEHYAKAYKKSLEPLTVLRIL